MFTEIIENSLRKVLIKISIDKNIDKNDILTTYLNETSSNMILKKYQYQDYTLLKDCFNNLYIPNQDDTTIELIGFINNENEIIFDKLIQKNIKKKIDLVNPDQS